MSPTSLTDLNRSFRHSALDWARELCDTCRPLLPPAQARMLRPDQLGVVSGVEIESPLAASVMALAPAVASAGDALPMAMRQHRAVPAAAVAESLAEAAIQAPDLLAEPLTPALLHYAHLLAHTTHLAATLMEDGTVSGGLLAPAVHPHVPAAWPRLLDALGARLQRAERGRGARRGLDWQQRHEAGAACRDAAARALRVHRGLSGSQSWADPRVRMLRSLGFATVYCGFAALGADLRQ